MEWTKINKNKIWKTEKQFDELFNSVSETEVIKSKIIDGVYYAAVKDLKNNKTSAVVCLIKNNNNDDFVYYKIMYEDECPEITKAPKEIIDCLSPSNNKQANIWRNNCKRNFQSKIK